MYSLAHSLARHTRIMLSPRITLKVLLLTCMFHKTKKSDAPLTRYHRCWCFRNHFFWTTLKIRAPRPTTRLQPPLPPIRRGCSRSFLAGNFNWGGGEGGGGFYGYNFVPIFFWVDTRGHTNQRLMAIFSGLGGHCGVAREEAWRGRRGGGRQMDGL